MEGDAAECLVDRDQVEQVLNEEKTWKSAGPSEVSLQLIAASGSRKSSNS